jgi:hypothetical protein
MSFSATVNRPLDPNRAYSRLRRVIDAFKFIRWSAEQGPVELERTKSRHVGATYGVEAELVKRIKARFRNELSFGEGK